ncbi:hypothetical protein [Armatimonas sp.]|uniref:hypothetical protein n=1 Tax=Armatimonas sp. TaxID=1872638 RepID=UPI00286D1620|nr:hypothetical protein [Armatimonas sp.]
MQTVRGIGLWQSDNLPDWPNPACFVDDSQDADVRAKVVEYLKAGEITACSSFDTCRLCGAQLSLAAQEDGYYTWNTLLAHYVGMHVVRLPDDFIQHVLSNPTPIPFPQDDEYDLSRYDDTWWKSQKGWHDGSQVEVVPFQSYYDSVGALWLMAVAQPVTAAQLKFIRRFADFTFFSTLALREALRSGEPLLLQHGFHITRVAEVTAEATALGLTLTHRRYSSREEWLQNTR